MRRSAVRDFITQKKQFGKKKKKKTEKFSKMFWNDLETFFFLLPTTFRRNKMWKILDRPRFG